MLGWMAWTVPTALIFLFVFACIGVLVVLELRTPGGDSRSGIFGIDSTRGDRLFISILGTVFLMLAWLGLYGTPLWGGLAVSVAWWVFVWKTV